MGIRVYYFNGAVIYPHASDWFAGEDKTLQIYQTVDHNAQFVIAEFSEGNWERVEHDPLPVPQPEEEPGPEDGEDENGEFEDR